MPFQKDKIRDVLSVLTIIRDKYRAHPNDRDISELRKESIKSVAKMGLQSHRFRHQDSAEKTIHDACARRLQFDIDKFDDLVDQWLHNNSMRLKDVLFSHSNKSQQAEVTKFFADGNLPDISKSRDIVSAPDKNLIIPEEIPGSIVLYEGAIHSITVNAYERSSDARVQSIGKYGCKCSVCEVLLADVYGAVATGYIHVHHLRPLSEIGAEYKVDPIQDLRPVCPNCHVIIHMKNPPYTIEEVKTFIEEQKNS